MRGFAIACVLGALSALSTEVVAQTGERAMPPAPGYGVTHANVIYGSYSGLMLLMDVKVPVNPTGFGVVHIPGSGFHAPLSMIPWELKQAEYNYPNEAALLDAGFTVFTINHRAAPRFRSPAALEDAQRAVRFIRANAATYGISPDWLGLAGESSGAALVGLLATLGEGTDAGIEPATTNAKKAQCAVGVMGSYDMLAMGYESGGGAYATNYIGAPAPYPEEAGLPGYEERFAMWTSASATRYLKPEYGPTPNYLLLHGDRDRVVPVAQSKDFEQKLREFGSQVTMEIMPDVGHAYPEPFRIRAANWMKECLNRTRPGQPAR
jgi:acetyl esterase/lipase